MTIRFKTITRASAIALVGAALPVAGCGVDHVHGFRVRPTPEMFTLTTTNAQANNNWHYMGNTNIRALVNDWGRLWLIDRPSRLVVGPTPY